MQIHVRYFAVLREITGKTQEIFPLHEGASIADLLAALEESYPRLQGLTGRLAVALQRAYASPETRLFEGAEVALIPPVSGGSDSVEPPLELSSAIDIRTLDGFFRLTHAPLVLTDVVDLVHGGRYGAIVSFVGTIRGQSQGREVRHLEYEAYPEMALAEMQKVAAFVQETWPLTQIAIHHRLGSLRVGEIAVVLAVSSPHRKEAFAAASATIDRLKETVPIWKKEFFSDGSSWVGWGP